MQTQLKIAPKFPELVDTDSEDSGDNDEEPEPVKLTDLIKKALKLPGFRCWWGYVNDEEKRVKKPAFTKGIYKGKEISYVAKSDPKNLKKKLKYKKVQKWVKKNAIDHFLKEECKCKEH